MCSTPNPVYAQQKVPDWEKASHPGTFAISQRMHSWTTIQKCTYVHCTYEEAFVWSSFPITHMGTESNSFHMQDQECPPGAPRPWPTVSEWEAQNRAKGKIPFSHLLAVPESIFPWERWSSWGKAHTHGQDWRLSITSEISSCRGTSTPWAWLLRAGTTACALAECQLTAS